MNWFKKKSRNKEGVTSWKNELQGVWRGSTKTQRPVCGMKFSTILQIPSTHCSTLLNNLVCAEQQLATMSGYNVKLVQMSGIQLARIFQRFYTPHKCHLLECPVCKENTEKGASRCRNSNIVYERVCLDCHDEVYRSARII